MKNSEEGFRFEEAEGRINGFEKDQLKLSSLRGREKKMKNEWPDPEKSVDTAVNMNACIMRVPGGEERDR